jgi:hypothetical protein
MPVKPSRHVRRYRIKGELQRVAEWRNFANRFGQTRKDDMGPVSHNRLHDRRSCAYCTRYSTVVLEGGFGTSSVASLVNGGVTEVSLNNRSAGASGVASAP